MAEVQNYRKIDSGLLWCCRVVLSTHELLWDYMHDWRKQVYDSLRFLAREQITESPLADRQLYKTILRTEGVTHRAATELVLSKGLERLAISHPQDAKILQLHYFEGQMVQAIADRLHLAEGTIYNRQRQAIERLADLLQTLEMQASVQQRQVLTEQLRPPSTTQPIGLDRHIDALVALLTKPRSPWLIALEGIGGIGKTTLADAVVRRVIEHNVFDAICWVTAAKREFSATKGLYAVADTVATLDELIRRLATQLLPAAQLREAVPTAELQLLLCHQLNSFPHLIVVDNLETLAELQTLVPTLRNMSNPTKLLLTSRQSLYTEPEIYHYLVPELSPPLSLALARQEAAIRNLPDLLHASDEELWPIIETVGGNPLAIRLVVGQTHVYALREVLANLRAVRGKTIENLYTHIYRWAWDGLDERARRTLLVMPLISELGGTSAHITQVSQLDPSAVATALDLLVRLNLVESRGGLNERRYTIHSLTATFLLEQVLRWGIPQ